MVFESGHRVTTARQLPPPRGNARRGGCWSNAPVDRMVPYRHLSMRPLHQTPNGQALPERQEEDDREALTPPEANWPVAHTGASREWCAHHV
jgi:hypothetical protein